MLEDMTISPAVDLAELCDECGESTAFGSGKFVNRYPVSNDEYECYRCDECDSKLYFDSGGCGVCKSWECECE